MIIFSVPNKPGSLYHALKYFKKNKVNMTKIESRPSKIKKWDYVFIVEYDNGPDQKKINKLLMKMEKLCDRRSTLLTIQKQQFPQNLRQTLPRTF